MLISAVCPWLIFCPILSLTQTQMGHSQKQKLRLLPFSTVLLNPYVQFSNNLIMFFFFFFLTGAAGRRRSRGHIWLWVCLEQHQRQIYITGKSQTLLIQCDNLMSKISSIFATFFGGSPAKHQGSLCRRGCQSRCLTMTQNRTPKMTFQRKKKRTRRMRKMMIMRKTIR